MFFVIKALVSQKKCNILGTGIYLQQTKKRIVQKRGASMKEFKPVKEGKVREIYDNGDSLIMVATDRISAFDALTLRDRSQVMDKLVADYGIQCRHTNKGQRGRPRMAWFIPAPEATED